jgi:sialate O-acetylesterase
MSFQLHGPYADNMVLQRSRPLTFRGSAGPGSVVRVELGEARAEVRADHQGTWEITLPAFEAGGPHTLRASSGDDALVFENVLIGEVWVCAGQSNMEWTVAISPDAEETISQANWPMIRLLKVVRVADPVPRQQIEARWHVCSPATIGDFSKVGYHHGVELFRTLNVPIGLIDAGWGGTVVEAWTPREALLADDEMGPVVAEYEASRSRRDELAAAYAHRMKQWAPPPDPGNSKFAAGWADPATDISSWPTMTLPCWWEAGGLRFHGAFWFRREVEVPPELAGRDLMLHLGACDKADTTYFNNEEVGSIPLDAPDGWRTPRDYRVPGRLVRAGRNTIAVRVFSNINNSGMTGPRDAMRLEAEGWSAPLAGDWHYQVEHNLGWTVRPREPWGPGNPHTPSILFNSMIAPLLPLAIRGVIWYQGESNEATSARYARLFPAMIRAWREAWQQGNFPFLFVQLPNFGPDNSSTSYWSEIRHAQERGLIETATAMVPTIDIGDPNDLHPPNKVAVGQRLAWAALAVAHDDPDPTLLCPRIESVAFAGREVSLTFGPLDGGLTAREGNPVGFELAGADDRLAPAHARIEGAQIIVWSDLVPAPRSLRYAFADSPVPNLANRRGLPLPPFRFSLDHPESNSLLASTRAASFGR